MRRTIQLMLLAGCTAIPTMATGQTQASQASRAVAAPQEGATVRVVRMDGNHANQVLRGRLSSLSGDTATLRVDDGYRWELTTVVLDQGRVLQVRTGHKSHTLQGMGIGALSGALAGGVLGAAMYQPCTSQEMFGCMMDFGRGYSIAAGATVLGVVGGLVGTVVGATHDTDTWSPVSHAPAVRVSVAPAAGGMVAGVRLEF